MNEFLSVDLDLRTIIVPSNIRNLGVEADSDVLRLYFEIPRYYGEFDLSEFDARINYENAGGEEDLYRPDDVSSDEGYVRFSWLVGSNVTAYKGDVKFNVCLKKVDAEGNVIKEFNTTPTIRPVLEGLETLEGVYQRYPDVIEILMAKVAELEKKVQ